MDLFIVVVLSLIISILVFVVGLSVVYLIFKNTIKNSQTTVKFNEFWDSIDISDSVNEENI